jgi:hypothetical protein
MMRVASSVRGSDPLDLSLLQALMTQLVSQQLASAEQHGFAAADPA